MILHLLRHAEAEERSPSLLDEERRLTEAGKKRMRLVAKGIAALEPGYDAILVSPLVRSRETAEPVAKACGFGAEFVETAALEPAADPGAVLDEVARGGWGTVLLVGHQPHMGRLFGRLLTGRGGLEVPLKKASLAAFECEGDPAAGRAELRLYLPPRLLERLGGRA